MSLLIGAVLALAVGVFAHLVGLSRERAFYTTVLIVVATYYVLFAVMGGSTSALVVETLIAGGFLVVAAVGFRRSDWLIAAGLAGHGVLDLFHGSLVTNPGVPAFWPPFCMSYDIVAAAFLAWLLLRKESD